ncbi:MAG: von Willebrand factor type A domain-containing protein [bacterium]|nr:von Willebrand factor type A domain-containing protein [bacterium]
MSENSEPKSKAAELEARLAALVMGEASDFEQAQLEELMSQQPELADVYDRLLATHLLLQDVGEGEYPSDTQGWKLSEGRRNAVLAVIDGEQPRPQTEPDFRELQTRKPWMRRSMSKPWLLAASAACVLVCGGLLVNALLLQSRARHSLASARMRVPREPAEFATPPGAVQSASSNEAGSMVAESRFAELSASISSESSSDTSMDPQIALSDIRGSLGGQTLPSPYYLYEDRQFLPSTTTGEASDELSLKLLSPSADSNSLPPNYRQDLFSMGNSGTGDSGMGAGGMGAAVGGMGGSAGGMYGGGYGGGGYGGGGYGGGMNGGMASGLGAPGSPGGPGGPFGGGGMAGGSGLEGTPLPATRAAEPAELGDAIIADKSGVPAKGDAPFSDVTEGEVNRPFFGQVAGAEESAFGVDDVAQREPSNATMDFEWSLPQSALQPPADPFATREQGFVDGLGVEDPVTRGRGLAENVTKESVSSLVRDEEILQFRRDRFDSTKQAEGKAAVLGVELQTLDSDGDAEPQAGRSAVDGVQLGYPSQDIRQEAAVAQQSQAASLPEMRVVDPTFSGLEKPQQFSPPARDKIEEQILGPSAASQEQADAVWLDQQEAKMAPSQWLSRSGSVRAMNEGERFGIGAKAEVLGRDAFSRSAGQLQGLDEKGLDEKSASAEPFSTFSLHVGDVSFKLAFEALARGEWPDASKVRVEEFVNAFDFHDPSPGVGEKIACSVEQTVHPFLIQRNLLRIAMRTASSGRASQTPLRLTLLLDNSGSMERADRRQTVRRAFETLAGQLSPTDQVTLISFASVPRLLADRVDGSQVSQLVERISQLPSEGGTNFESALQLAMEKALEQYDPNAQNRIVLLTDGAVNLGDADPQQLSNMIAKIREAGVAFDAAGISARDLNDEVLEALARQGDGRYYLLDSAEAVSDGFAQQIAGAFRPAAKNVKVQVEFNPQRVARYKLLGFEKHRLKQEDFRNDAVDAAELAAAEAGVALYQVSLRADGVGDIGSVSVRFQDLASGRMIENRWPIPYQASLATLEQATPAARITTAAALLAVKLRGEPLGESVDLAELARIVSSLPPNERSSQRVQQLQFMIERARDLVGSNEN